MNGMSGDTACKHWKEITGERVSGPYTKLKPWQIQSMKKYGIHLDDITYEKELKVDVNSRNKELYTSAKNAFRKKRKRSSFEHGPKLSG